MHEIIIDVTCESQLVTQLITRHLSDVIIGAHLKYVRIRGGKVVMENMMK